MPEQRLERTRRAYDTQEGQCGRELGVYFCVLDAGHVGKCAPSREMFDIHELAELSTEQIAKLFQF